MTTELATLVVDHVEEARPTAGFQRVVHRAAIHVQSAGKHEVNGANVLVALFSERESHAVFFLQEQDVSRLDVVNYISHGIVKYGDLARIVHREHSEEELEDGSIRYSDAESRRFRGGREGQGPAIALLRQPQQEGRRRQDRHPDRPREGNRAHGSDIMQAE